MIEISTNTVAEIVTKNYKAADIFKKYNIDFCCGGKISLQRVCEKKKIDYEQISFELGNLDNSLSASQNYNNWDLDFLLDYVVNVHHKYVSENTPLIIQYTEKVARVHGKEHPENIEIDKLFKEISSELLPHMEKEENVLFPFVKQLFEANKYKHELERPFFHSAQNPIKAMEMEHENAGEIFEKIKKLSNSFTPPEDACNTYRVLYAKLEEFESDLHTHIHIENNIVFPKAIILEKNIFVK
jgi:regulator of cell morphogenesis and NO signaling